MSKKQLDVMDPEVEGPQHDDLPVEELDTVTIRFAVIRAMVCS